ncbi:MAG: hypothetical protein Q4E60_08185 [Bacteroidales bacterium]|nr:hypothetical protein [Bacteroidales bacterium]
MKHLFKRTAAMLAGYALCMLAGNAQTEVMAWSNITGIRVDGELIDFESMLGVGNTTDNILSTHKEWQTSNYHRNGNAQEVTTAVRNVNFFQRVTDLERGLVKVDIDVKSDTTLKQSAYFSMELPAEHYADAKVKIGGKKISIVSSSRNLQLALSKSAKAVVYNNKGVKTLAIQLLPTLKKGAQSSLSIQIKADGKIDHEDVKVALDTEHPGNLFTGFGGNFRLQNPRLDPTVIDYCLKNLRVAYGRVELPWRNWQPNENEDPIAAAKAGNLHAHVKESIEMAQRLKAQGMPVILSCWFPPEWAIDGDPKSYKRKGGVQAFKLDPQKSQQIYKSLADYMKFAKQVYGVEFAMFSFNESDLGIDVLHTPAEHNTFIKEFGAYMASQNLPTKLLLGDNSDATTFDFILPGLNDPETLPYIGAVSFHSWRGCDDETLRKWAGAAKQINVPLIVGEGSTDAAAHRYAEIFNESTFALYEINLYTRLCSICQPLSILQWQLTSDYSLLWGAGIYRSEGELRPTQRFWNIKQLASTPAESLAIPVTSSKNTVNCAAFGNIARGEYAVHMVNNGAACEAVVTGIPQNVKEMTVYVTNTVDGMKPSVLKVENGTVRVALPPISFVTMISK